MAIEQKDPGLEDEGEWMRAAEANADRIEPLEESRALVCWNLHCHGELCQWESLAFQSAPEADDRVGDVVDRFACRAVRGQMAGGQLEGADGAGRCLAEPDKRRCAPWPVAVFQTSIHLGLKDGRIGRREPDGALDSVTGTLRIADRFPPSRCLDPGDHVVRIAFGTPCQHAVGGGSVVPLGAENPLEDQIGVCRRGALRGARGLLHPSRDGVEPDDRGDDRHRLLRMARALPGTRQEDGRGDPFR